MSAILAKYESKVRELEALQAEVEMLENSPELKQEKEFQGKLEVLLDQYSMSAKDVVRILGDEVKASGTRKPRKASTWVNPNTGEKVVTAGGNHKTLKDWRKEYGDEEVASWKQKG